MKESYLNAVSIRNKELKNYLSYLMFEILNRKSINSLSHQKLFDYYSLSIVAPYYGTKMYYDLVDDGIQLDKKPWEYFFHQTGELMANTKISKKVLEKFLRLNELNKNYGYV